MRSFTLSAFASLAFGLFCSAAPTPQDLLLDVVVDLDLDLGLKRDVNTPALGRRLVDAVADADVLGLVHADAFVHAKRGGGSDSTGSESGSGHQCLESVLTGVVSEVEVIVAEITSLTRTEATVECLTPLLKEIKNILSVAIADVKALLSLDINAVLTSVTTGELLDVSGVASLICSVLRIVLELLKVVLGLVTIVVKADILTLVCEIVDLLAQLLSCILQLVEGVLSGLLGEVISLVSDLLSFVLTLGVKSLVSLLCINL